jgi:hypothetical protein
MQVAWFNHLSVIRGSKDAALFKDLILNLQQNPDLVTNVKQQLLARKLLSTPVEQQHLITQPQQPPPFIQHMHCPPPSQPPPLPPQPQQPPLAEKPPILAQDLEAMLLRESRQSGPPPHRFMSSSQFMGVDALLEDSSSLNEVLKNDPVLSEILHQSDESSPDSGCWGSVNSILNSKSTFEAEMSNKQNVVSESPRSGLTSSTYVPLYLRRAGMNTSSDDVSIGFSENRISQKQEEPMSTFGRFTQEPVGNSFFPPPQVPMFQRQSSPNTDPFTGSSSFIGSSSTTLSAATSLESRPESSKLPQLTYANVLRNPQLLRESNDPLTRIRNLGTQGSREVDRDGPGSNPQQPKLFSYFGGGQW